MTLKPHSLATNDNAYPDVSGNTTTEIELPFFPLIGLVGNIVGLCVALVLIPDDPGPVGALANSATAMALGTMLGPLVAGRRSFKALLRAEHLVAMSTIYWLLFDLIQGAYPLTAVSRDEVWTAFAAIGIFNCFFSTAVAFRSRWVPGWIRTSSEISYSGATLFNLTLVAFALGVFKFAYPCGFDPVKMIFYLTQDRWSAPWIRGDFGGWEAFVDHMQYFGYGLPALSVMIADKLGWRSWRTSTAAVFALAISAFLIQTGSRRIVGVMFGIALIIWILNQNRITVGKIVGLFAMLGALIFLMELMVALRGSGLAAFANMHESERKQITTIDRIHVDDNFLRLSQIIKFVPDYFPFVGFRYITWVLIRPIPRVFWPSKPVSPGFDLPTALGTQGVSLSCSSIGEFYLCGGLPAVAIGGLFFGFLSKLASNILVLNRGEGRLFIFGSLVMSIFTGMRSLIELILMSYVVLTWIVLTRLRRIWIQDSRAGGRQDESEQSLPNAGQQP